VQWVLAAMIVLVLGEGLALLAILAIGTVAGMIVAALTGHSLVLTAGLQADYGVILLKSVGATWSVFAFSTLVAYAAGSIFRSAAPSLSSGFGTYPRRPLPPI